MVTFVTHGIVMDTSNARNDELTSANAPTPLWFTIHITIYVNMSANLNKSVFNTVS